MSSATITPPTKDNWIDENDPNGKHGGTTTLVVGRQADADSRDVVMRFDLSELQTNIRVEKAILSLYQDSAIATAPAKISRILSGNEDWSELNSDWLDRDDPTDWIGGGGGCHIIGVDIAGSHLWSGTPANNPANWHEFELVPIEVEALIKNNYGFKFYLPDRTTALAREYVWRSRSHGTVATRPKLWVQWTWPKAPNYYVLNVWDSQGQIREVEGGKLVAPNEVRPNRYMMLEGVAKIGGTEIYESLIDRPNVLYIESVKYDARTNRVSIHEAKETMMQALMTRLGGMTK